MDYFKPRESLCWSTAAYRPGGRASLPGLSYDETLVGQSELVSEIKVHPTPCVHIFSVGCTDFSFCAARVCCFCLNIVIPLYEEEHINKVESANFGYLCTLCTIYTLLFEH